MANLNIDFIENEINIYKVLDFKLLILTFKDFLKRS
jgi:hypothetical protein